MALGVTPVLKHAENTVSVSITLAVDGALRLIAPSPTANGHFWIIGMPLRPLFYPFPDAATLPAPLTRDARYHRTWQRDQLRQKIRRIARRPQALLEKTCHWPRWRQQSTQLLRTGQRPPTLSVCFMAMNAQDRIGPLLKYLRPVVNELVVGVDSKSTDNTFDLCCQLADVCFIVDNDAPTCNGGLEAIVSRCTQDWILRLDDDEFPEPELWSLLPGLLANTRYTHFKLPRLHLAQATDANTNLTWIDDGYLYPDYQTRLFRNDPNAFRFPPAIGHVQINMTGPRGKLHAINLVHLNLAINPRPKREAKLRNYILRHQNPNTPQNNQWVHPINETALLFENYPYTIKPYTHPSPHFRQLLCATVLGALGTG